MAPKSQCERQPRQIRKQRLIPRITVNAGATQPTHYEHKSPAADGS